MSPTTYTFDKKVNGGKMLWTPAMHNDFLDALETLGEANAVPTIILEHLGWKNVSRYQIASHLQKHRARLRSGREIRYRHHGDEMLESFETPVSAPATATARRQKQRIGIESSETIDDSQTLPDTPQAASRAAKVLATAKRRRSGESAQPASKKKKKKKKVARSLVEEDDIQQQHFGSLLDLAEGRGRVRQQGGDDNGATKSTSRKAKRPVVPELLPSGSGLLPPPLPQLPTSAHGGVDRSPRTELLSELAPDGLATTKTQDPRAMLLAMQSLRNEEGRNEHASGSREQRPAALPTFAVDLAAQLQYAVDDIVRENDRLRMQNQRLEAKMKRLEHAWKNIEGTISQFLRNDALVEGNEESPVAGEQEEKEEEDEGDHGAQAVPDANADGNVGDGDSGRT